MWIEKNILYCVCQRSLYYNEVVLKCIDDRLRFTKGKDYLILVDARTVTGMEKDATEICI